MGRTARDRAAWPRRLAVAGVVSAAAVLALYWVFLVPIFQSPDEAVHLDYALNLLQAGHLLSVRERPPAPAAFDLVIHPDAAFLEAESDFLRVRDTHGAMPADYGTCRYYRQVDAQAPAISSPPNPLTSPSMITQYPFGYYALLALWLALVHAVTGSLTALLFFARILSVLLLAASLTLCYGIARELGIRHSASLGLSALIGFFPMTSFVSSYVQPDNMAFTLVSLSTYLALRARRSQRPGLLMVGLGLTAGLLLVTKWHFYVCLIPWLAVAVLMREGSSRVERLRRGIAIALPSAVLGLVQFWVIAGATLRSYSPDGHGRGIFDPLLLSMHTGPLALAQHLGHELAAAYANFYLGGTTFLGFWGRFGNDDTRLIVGSLRSDAVVRATILLLTTLILVLMVVSRGRVARRLIRLARHGKGNVALRLVMADPLFNAYLTFTAFMFVLFALSDNAFAAQGRNWLPFLLPIFLVPLRYAGHAFSSRRVRRALTVGMAGLLGAFCLMGSLYAPQVVRERYYQPVSAVRPVVPFACWPLPALAGLPGSATPQS